MLGCVEIVSVGNELLIGKTANTNSRWLARRITSLGLRVSRITVIGDRVEEIAKTIRDAVNRIPEFVITTGGLGPTFDDKTLEGLAKAFDARLEIHPTAMEMIKKKYEDYSRTLHRKALKLTPARVKMAKLPEKAEPLPNPVGTAPGVLFRKGNTTIFALPGVPSEMTAIFEDSLLPILTACAVGLAYYEASLYVSGIMESEMAPMVDQVMRDNPHIYIKSHPQGAERRPEIELHLSTTAENIKTAKKRVGRALMQISELVKTTSGSIVTPKPNRVDS
jgi:molybdenum cofactor synthesis domain-containing protein